MRFMQTESVLQTKNRSEPAKNRFSVALIETMRKVYLVYCWVSPFLWHFDPACLPHRCTEPGTVTTAVQFHSLKRIIQPTHDKTNKMTCASSEDSAQPGQRRLRLAWACTQSDESLRCLLIEALGEHEHLLATREVLKPPPFRLAFQNLPWSPADVNA